MPITKQCPKCKGYFDVKPSHANKRKYCSMKCRNEAKKKPRLNKVCAYCMTEYEVYNNKWRKDSKFCSVQCMGKYHTGENSPRYIHGYGNKHPEKMKMYRDRHYRENKEEYFSRALIGKAKRRDLKADHSFQDWIELLRKHDNRCYYCKEKMTKKAGPKQRTRDHIIPVSLGGKDNIENIVPACRSCNSSKGAKNLDEWEGATTIENTLKSGSE